WAATGIVPHARSSSSGSTRGGCTWLRIEQVQSPRVEPEGDAWWCRVMRGGRGSLYAHLLCRLRKLRPGLGVCAVAGFLEIGAEQAGQVDGLAVIGLRVGPGLAGREETGFDARDGERYGEAEEVVGAHVGLVEFAVERGAEQAPGGRDVDALAGAVAAA